MNQSAQQPQCAILRGRADGSAAKTGDQVELRRVGCYLTDALLRRVLRMIFPDQRKQERYLDPPLVGYLGAVRTSNPYPLADISLSGFCMLTDERWTSGTEMPITLQQVNLPEDDDAACFTVQSTVVRSGKDGVGFSILLNEEDSNAAHGNPLRVKWISRLEMQQFLYRLKETAPAVPGQPEDYQHLHDFYLRVAKADQPRN
jgi:hypothetical protein